MRKVNTLTKQRFKPQVSALFDAGSIRIDADSINPKKNIIRWKPSKHPQEFVQILAHRESRAIERDVSDWIWASPGIG
jgi:exoribonuclease II